MTKTKQHAVRVLLVDDHSLIRQGLRTLLKSEADLEVVGEAGDGEKAILQAKSLSPDIVIMDISMPKLNGIEATRRILADRPETRVIALSIHSEKHFVDDMLRAGALGYVLKDNASEELVKAIHTVVRGEGFLSGPLLSTVIKSYREVEPEKGISADATVTPQASDKAQSLLRTKLHCPEPPKDLVSRTQLLERLDAGQNLLLTLVSAPAGYGKSVLVSSWVTQNQWPFAWFSIDTDDSDLRQFLAYFSAAVQDVFPQSCRELIKLIMAPQLPPLSILVTNLINEFDAFDEPFILVLEDYHRISSQSAVNELLQLLLAHPPVSLHLVLITRRDPPLSLATLRAHGQINELRMHDLRFDSTETRGLLNKVAGHTASDKALVNIGRELEGWVTGLCLVSLVLRRSKEPDEYLQHLHGGVQQTQEYMIQEVIAEQPPWVRAWLLKSSILNRFCASLCNAVCAEESDIKMPNFDGSEFIQALHDNNLFSISLDSQGEWFRFQHLFQALLQQELTKRWQTSEILKLHSRASTWFEGQQLYDEAIQYAQQAGDALGAANIIERHYLEELNQDRFYVLNRWLEKIPEEIIGQRPTLLLIRAYVAFFKQQLTQLDSLLSEIELLLNDEEQNDSFWVDLDFFRGYLLFCEGKTEESEYRLETVLKQAADANQMLIAEVEVHLSLSRYINGKGALAIKALKDRMLNATPLNSVLLPRLIGVQGIIHILAGKLQQARFDARHMREAAMNGQSLLNIFWSDYLEALSDVHCMDLEPALRHFTAASEHSHSTDARAAVDALAGIALTQQLMRNPDAANTSVQRLIQFAFETNDPVHVSVARSCQARIQLLQGNLVSAINWAQGASENLDIFSLLMWLEVPATTQARILIVAGSTESLEKASKLLQEIQDLSEACWFSCHLIETTVLRSLLLAKQGRKEVALVSLQEAMAMAEPGAWMRPFVEAGQPILELLERLADNKGLAGFERQVFDKLQTTLAQPLSAAPIIPQANAVSAAWDGEPLTNRELDILELLAQRLQNKVIGERLFISPETVKTHLRHLYLKLGVNNRREAVAKAAEILKLTQTVPHTP